MSKLKTINIKGKEYVEVTERIRVFRETFPLGSIMTEILTNENGVCVFKATIIVDNQILAVGHAYEKEGSTFINKTSYIENCETSAVGRALGMLGIGIDTSIATAEEVNIAIINQDPVLTLETVYKNDGIEKARTLYNQMSEADREKCKKVIEKIRKDSNGTEK
jgi:hypothetical protein